MDSNHRRHRQQIYSLPHLATLVTTHCLKGGAKVLFIFHSRKSCGHFFLAMAHLAGNTHYYILYMCMRA